MKERAGLMIPDQALLTNAEKDRQQT